MSGTSQSRRQIKESIGNQRKDKEHTLFIQTVLLKLMLSVYWLVLNKCRYLKICLKTLRTSSGSGSSEMQMVYFMPNKSFHGHLQIEISSFMYLVSLTSRIWALYLSLNHCQSARSITMPKSHQLHRAAKEWNSTCVTTTFNT